MCLMLYLILEPHAVMITTHLLVKLALLLANGRV